MLNETTQASKEVTQLVDFISHWVNKNKNSVAVISELKNVDEQNNNKQYVSDIDLIIKIVSVSYGIMPSVIISTKRRGHYYEAKRMCFCLLTDCLGFSAKEIGVIFNRHEAQVTTYLSMFFKMDRNNRVDAAFMERFDKLKEEFLTNKNN